MDATHFAGPMATVFGGTFGLSRAFRTPATTPSNMHHPMQRIFQSQASPADTIVSTARLMAATKRGGNAALAVNRE
jgi:hypothetical protein